MTHTSLAAAIAGERLLDKFSKTRMEYKAVVSPTREGWRYVVMQRKVGKGPWMEFAPFRTFTSRAEAERYIGELES